MEEIRNHSRRKIRVASKRTKEKTTIRKYPLKRQRDLDSTSEVGHHPSSRMPKRKSQLER